MFDQERLKQLLREAKSDVDNLDDWMKTQEPAPGVSYKDWRRADDEKEKIEDERVA